MSTISDRVKDELKDPEYRHAYSEEFLDMILARQIRALRKDRGWSQAELASILGTQQSRISEIESEEYGALSIATLKDLARVFDVYLNVSFTSFSELLTKVDRTGMADLSVPTYPDDPAFRSVQATISVLSSNKAPAAFGSSWHFDGPRLSDSMTTRLATTKLRLATSKMAA